MARKIYHLAQFLVHGPTYHSLAMWRHPNTAYTRGNWTRPGFYQHIARTCERGMFDMVFFADLTAADWLGARHRLDDGAAVDRARRSRLGSQGRIFAARYSPSSASNCASLSSHPWKPNRRAFVVLRTSSQVRSRVASR